MSLWRRLAQEAHRRSLWQVLGVYLVGAWVAYQVILGLYDGLALPDWVPPLAIVLFLIGLPIVLATAMVQEGPPTRETFMFRREADLTLIPGFDTDLSSDAEVGGIGPATEPGIQRHLTWRRSLAAGFAAFVLLALSTTGFMAVQKRGTLLAQGVIGEADAILLAQFDAPNTDPVLASVLTEALRIDLMQSNVVRLADPAAVSDALQRMDVPADTRLNAETALHAAEREGWKAVIAGDISSVGGQYMLSAQLLATSGGSVLGVFRATAADSTQLLNAVTSLSKQLREKVGESLKAVRASPPLEQVTTSSLAALRKYAEGSDAYFVTGDRLRSLELLDEAIALDSSFAMAWRRKGLFLNNLVLRPSERNHALTRAWELRDRLSEKERLLATAAYQQIVQGDPESAIATYLRLIQLDSLQTTALNNLGILYNGRGRFADAEPLLDRAVRLSAGRNANTVINLAGVKYRQGRTDEARAVLTRSLELLPNNPQLNRQLALLEGAEQRWSVADSMLRSHQTRFRDNPVGHTQAIWNRIHLAHLYGRPTEAEALPAVAAPSVRGAPNVHMILLLDAAAGSLLLTGDARRGQRLIEAALQRIPLDSLEPSQRPFNRLAELHAEAGRFDIAEQYLQLSSRRAGSDTVPAVRFTRAYIALARSDGPAALDYLRTMDTGNCLPCDRQHLGRAYELVGQRDSALMAYETFLTAPDYARLSSRLVWRPLVLVRAAELHADAGNLDRARELYLEFIQLWENAEPALQHRVQAARQALARLGGPG